MIQEKRWLYKQPTGQSPTQFAVFEKCLFRLIIFVSQFTVSPTSTSVLITSILNKAMIF